MLVLRQPYIDEIGAVTEHVIKSIDEFVTSLSSHECVERALQLIQLTWIFNLAVLVQPRLVQCSLVDLI